MIRKVISFVLTLALGILLGYVLAPTIDSVVKEKVSADLVDGIKNEANNKAQDGLDSLQNKE